MSQATELTERLRACMTEVSFADYDYQIPDSPAGIEDLAPFEDCEEWESAAIIYAFQDSLFPAISLQGLTDIIGWTLHGEPDLLCTAAFMQDLVCQGRVIVNEDNTFSLLQ